MKGSGFNWDKLFEKATWNEVRENSPLFVGQRLPSFLHEEAGLVYLTSLDLDFALSDVGGLKEVVGEIESILQRAVESKRYYKAAAASADLTLISNLLAENA